MPIYEYRCAECQKKFSILVGVVADKVKLCCPRCQSENINRCISSFAVRKSEEEVLENLADPTKIGDLKDPRSVRRWAEKLGKQFGDELGDDFEKSLDELEEGYAKEKEGEESSEDD